MGKAGKREYVQVLRLLETFALAEVHGAVRDALRLGAIGYDAVKHLVLCRVERRPPRLDLDRLSLSAESRGAPNIRRQLYEPAGRSGAMTDTPQVLLAHHLKTLKLPTFLREYDKIARQCAAEGVDHVRYLLRLAELELIDRERRMVERRIRQAKFPTPKSLDSFDFKAIASLNKMLVLELARCAYIERRENVIALGNSGTGKSHIALGLGLAACQKGLTVGFTNGRRPGSRTDGGQGRKTPAALPETAGEIPLADYRRAWIRAALQDRRRIALRGVQPALRTRLHHGHFQPAVR